MAAVERYMSNSLREYDYMDTFLRDEEYLKSLTLLYVEDDELAREQFAYRLSDCSASLITAENGREGLEAWRTHRPDIIITDIQMPLLDGLSMAEEIRAQDPSIPIIILSAFDNSEYLLKAINIGIESFATKPLDTSRIHQALLKCAHRLRAEEQLMRSQTTLLRAHGLLECQVVEQSDALEYKDCRLKDFENSQRNVEEKLVANERFLSLLTENIPGLLSYWGTDYLCKYANKAYLDWFGKSLDQMIGISNLELLGEEMYRKHEPYILRAFQGEPQHFENTIVKPDGETMQILVNYLPDSSDGTVRGLYVHVFDISEQKLAAEEKAKLENKLHQSQKMEAIGQLAGGIAHDFNNILSIISGYCALMKTDDMLNTTYLEYLERIEAASERASQLTGSLLAFSRKQELEYKNEDLNYIVRHVHQLLSRIIGEDIQLTTLCRQESLPVYVDSGQIEQVLINLATNARDAMPDGGEFTITTDLQEVDQAFVSSHGNEAPGGYAVMTVSDTGVGIDREHQGQIFEPFFTTKEVGKGTGLGMSIVFGIIQQHKGFIDFYSEPGDGAAFKIYLPILESEASAPTDKKVTVKPRGGNETILVAEDDTFLRRMIATSLKKYGYSVIEAADGQAAVDRFAENCDSIDFILMDVVMPKKNGREAYREIRQLKPGVKALFTSGYVGDFLNSHGIDEEGIEFIMKPVRPNELLGRIREILDGCP